MKEYAPQYGFQNLAVEDDLSNIGEMLGLKRIDSPRYLKNYLAKLDEIDV